MIAEVAVGGAVEMTARLRLRAPADTALRNISVSGFSNDDIVLEIDGGQTAATVDSLAADGEQIWVLRLSPSRPLVKTAHVFIEVTFTEQRDEDTAVQRYLFTTLQIEPTQLEGDGSLVAIEIKGDDLTVSRQRPGTVYVVLTNNHARDLEVTNLEWFKPDFVALSMDQSACAAETSASSTDFSRTVKARESLVIPVHVCPNEQVVPGKYELLATAQISSGGFALGSVSASREVEIGVLGESEFLNLFGIPSLLLLPGFLLIVTFGFLRKLASKGDDEPFNPKPGDVYFWAGAIALSLVFAFAYPLLTRLILPGGERDYLVGYGLLDLVYVYSLAIGFGVLFFVLSWIVTVVAREVRSFQRRRTLPVVGDDAITILKKLERADANVNLPVTRLTGRSATEELLVLQAWSDAETVWVAPHIHLKINDTIGDDNETRDANNAYAKVTTGDGIDAAIAYTMVRDGQLKGWWAVSWDTVGAISGPVHKKREEIEPPAAQSYLIREVF